MKVCRLIIKNLMMFLDANIYFECQLPYVSHCSMASLTRGIVPHKTVPVLEKSTFD